MKNTPLLTLSKVKQTYKNPDGNSFVVLEDINFSLFEKEIVGLLGKSGSGKSTILRIVSALITPTSGMVTCYDQPIITPDARIAMVFQNFALFPWLTVIENIGIGLKARHILQADITERCSRAINLIGLDGFENNYPKDLSGGMRQRVGIARALVVSPEILLMDEPFSALDVLTGEVLKTDLLDLWTEKATSLKSILIVTHNIEEAVLLCDRIMVLSSHPGKIIAEIPIDLKHPRDRLSIEFRKIVDSIYDLVTRHLQTNMHADSRVIPNIEPIYMEGLMDKLVAKPYNGRVKLTHLALRLNLSMDGLFPLIAALQIMKFAELTDGSIHMTSSGRVYLEGNAEERKKIFGRHLIQYVPLASHIRRALLDDGKSVSYKRISKELKQDLNCETVKDTMHAVIMWGKYGELFIYDSNKQVFTLYNQAK